MLGFVLWLVAVIAGYFYAYNSAKMQEAGMFSDSPRRFRQALHGKATTLASLAFIPLIVSLILLFPRYKWWTAAFLAGWLIWMQILFWTLPKLVRNMMAEYWKSTDRNNSDGMSG